MSIKIIILNITCFFILSSCVSSEKEIPLGKWRGIIHIQNQELPFNFETKRSDHGLTFTILNGEEEIDIDSIFINKDSIIIPMHIFDASIKARIGEKSLDGVWVKHYAEDYEIHFSAQYGTNERFKIDSADPAFKVSGKWAVTFYDQEDTTDAIGIFKQSEGQLTGTFLTSTGDYRFLEGVVNEDKIFLSAFNGTSAYLFKAKIKGNRISGDFYSGKTGYKKWKAIKSNDVSLPDADQLTSLNKGYSTFKFSFPDLSGDTVSHNDIRFQNKVLIIQILGTWCPNCMDETAFLAEWHEKNKHKPVEIIGLAFERKNDLTYAKKLLNKFINKYDVGYPILFAGSKDKENVERTLPMLDRLRAFPTTLFIDKKGKIRKIHTGFSGPGTGEYYERFKSEFNNFVNQLIEEDISELNNKET